MIQLLYRFHVYYRVRRMLKRLQVHLPFEDGFSPFENPYSREKFLKLCNDYGVPNDLTKYRNKGFYSTYQVGQMIILMMTQ